MSFADTLRRMPDFVGGSGKSESEITACEEKLGLHFAKEYRNYLTEIGLACFDNRELTGICNTERLNVVSVTSDAKNRELNIPSDWYVVEDTYIDGILLWQASDGTVYRTAPRKKPVAIAESLEEYYRSI